MLKYWHFSFNYSSISLYSVQRAYILRNELADLEAALIKYTLNYLNEKVKLNILHAFLGLFDFYNVGLSNFWKGFVLVLVPDILHHSIIVNATLKFLLQKLYPKTPQTCPGTILAQNYFQQSWSRELSAKASCQNLPKWSAP